MSSSPSRTSVFLSRRKLGKTYAPCLIGAWNCDMKGCGTSGEWLPTFKGLLPGLFKKALLRYNKRDLVEVVTMLSLIEKRIGMGQLLSEPILTKSTSKTVTHKFTIGASSMQGWRVSMEDAHSILPSLQDGKSTAYFAVFDGHGGKKVSQHASLNLHKYIMSTREFETGKIKSALEFAFVDLDKEMRRMKDIVDEMSGSTAVVILIKNNTLYCANLGDSRAIACVDGNTVALSEDHKPNNPEEHKRILAAGGFVDADRVNGSLALSRAFGDYQFKADTVKPPCQQMVSPCPDIVELELNTKWSFIVLACDGIWEVLSNDEVKEFVDMRLQNGMSPELICEQLMDKCVAKDTESSGGLGCDNMTVIIVVFNWKSGDHI